MGRTSRGTPPKYQLHRPSGRAKVVIQGKTIWLGKHGSPESKDRYKKVIQNWIESNERWKPIAGTAGAYEVSDLGRVRRVCDDPSESDLVTQTINRYGYKLACILFENDQRKQRLVHRLVLEAFVGPCPAGSECNHLSGDKEDNRLCNLQWITPQENSRHTFSVLSDLAGRKKHTVLSASDVQVIRAMRKRGDSRYKIAKQYGITYHTVYEIDRGKIWGYLPNTNTQTKEVSNG